MNRITGEGPNPSGLCQCGCGRKTQLSAFSRRGRCGNVAGTPQRFIRGHGYSHRGPQYIIDPDTQCWNWQLYKTNQGYGRISRTGKERLAHRQAWIDNRGAIPEGMCVLHKCDNPSCVNPDHLFLGTPADNNLDRDTKGRHKALRGSSNGISKLTEEDIPRIRQLLKSGLSQYRVADMFGVHQSTIWRVSAGNRWTHV
jgi:hypothetical protein